MAILAGQLCTNWSNEINQCGRWIGTAAATITLIYEEAGHKPTMSAMPGIMVKGLGLFNPIMREMAEMLYEYEKPFVIDSGKYERAFGGGTTPHREAVRQTLEWFKTESDRKGKREESSQVATKS